MAPHGECETNAGCADAEHGDLDVRLQAFCRYRLVCLDCGGILKAAVRRFSVAFIPVLNDWRQLTCMWSIMSQLWVLQLGLKPCSNLLLTAANILKYALLIAF